MTWLTLHSASQVWLLAGLLSAFLGTLVLGISVWRRQKISSNTSKLIASQSAALSNLRSGTTLMIDRPEHWPLVLIFLTGISLVGNIWLMRREFVRQQFVEMHDVRVLDRKDDLVFQMDVEDPDTHHRVPFMIRFCPDYIPTREIQAGTILSYLKYERHELDNCSEIAPDTLGYTLRRDNHAEPVTFDSGQTSAQTESRSAQPATIGR